MFAMFEAQGVNQMDRKTKWIFRGCMMLAFCLSLTLLADAAWARCRRGWRSYRAKNGRSFCCPPGTKGYYRGYRGISCKRVARRGRRRGYRRPTRRSYRRPTRRPRFERAGYAGSLRFSFNSIQANAAVRRVKTKYFHRKRCRVVGLYGRSAQKFRSAAARINRVISSRGFSNAMHMHHRYYRRWERYNGSTKKILYHIQRRRWKVVVNSFARTRKYPCRADVANGHTNAFANLGVGFLLISKNYLNRANVRDLARTVIHEAMHTLGYSHRGLPAWRKRYNNTVPPFVGCLVKYWNNAAYRSRSAQAKIVRYCTTGGGK